MIQVCVQSGRFKLKIFAEKMNMNIELTPSDVQATELWREDVEREFNDEDATRCEYSGRCSFFTALYSDGSNHLSYLLSNSSRQ